MKTTYASSYSRYFKMVLFTPFFLSWNTGVLGGPLEDLAPLHWYQIENSKLSDIAPNPLPENNSGHKAVISAWNGAVYDTSRDKLIVWGGGHADYSGNEIYAFDLASLTWERLTEPSSLVNWTEGDKKYQDGAPVSRHTYGYIDYIPPPFDRLFVAGGGGLWKTGKSDTNTFFYHFATATWQYLQASVPFNNGSIGALSVYDPLTRKIWVHNAGAGSFLSSYNPVNDTWQTHGNMHTEPDGWIPYTLSAAIDPIRRKLVAIGNNQVYIWSLSNNQTIANTKLATSGDTEILGKPSPGFQYDPASDSFVAWAGGSDVYQLKLGTGKWERIPAAITNTVTPPPQTEQGTFGRFRYIPSKNVFVVVTSTLDNVFIYKLGPKPIASTPIKPNAASVNTKPL
ncbi:MAG: hypothetical protein OEZ43_08340 [Gammaproteobacteria bacterium]|nr:hypothetical protein [Gammaproteobacteria bacterium]